MSWPWRPPPPRVLRELTPEEERLVRTVRQRYHRRKGRDYDAMPHGDGWLQVDFQRDGRFTICTLFFYRSGIGPCVATGVSFRARGDRPAPAIGRWLALRRAALARAVAVGPRKEQGKPTFREVINAYADETRDASGRGGAAPAAMVRSAGERETGEARAARTSDREPRPRRREDS